MLSRRQFFVGACCLVHAGPALAQAQKSPSFFCATLDEETKPIVRRRGKGATLHRPERWRLSHNETPDSRLITLNVGFMGGTRAQKREVKQIASEWIGGGLEKHLRFVFDTPLERSHIRVGFKKGDNISAVGALARAIKSKPTMNLSPPLTRRAILHEFGHALGLRHEHHHPSGGIVSNRDAVFARYPKWSKAMIEDNIFKKFDKSYSCQGSGFDPDSVMLYQFDEGMTLNGVASKSNEYISRGDQRCLLRTYRA